MKEGPQWVPGTKERDFTLSWIMSSGEKTDHGDPPGRTSVLPMRNMFVLLKHQHREGEGACWVPDHGAIL